MKHLMIDIETLATPDNIELVPIWSISAVAFDVNSDIIDSIDLLINPESCEIFGSKIDVITISWLTNQDTSVRENFRNSVKNGIDISEALIILEKFVLKYNPKYIWANDPDFDLSILKQYYLLAYDNFPWLSKTGRSIRTIKMLLNELGEFIKENNHSSLDDCMNQIELVKKYYYYIYKLKNL